MRGAGTPLESGVSRAARVGHEEKAMLTVFLLLGIAALVLTLVHAMGKLVLWPSVLILVVIELLRVIPMGK